MPQHADIRDKDQIDPDLVLIRNERYRDCRFPQGHFAPLRIIAGSKRLKGMALPRVVRVAANYLQHWLQENDVAARDLRYRVEMYTQRRGDFPYVSVIFENGSRHELIVILLPEANQTTRFRGNPSQDTWWKLGQVMGRLPGRVHD